VLRQFICYASIGSLVFFTGWQPCYAEDSSYLENRVIEISAGAYHTVALKEDGTVWSWGNQNFESTDDYDEEQSCNSKAEQVESLEDIKAIAAGYHHVVALKEDGTVWSWGNNVFGQLGHTDFVVRNNQPMMVVDLKDVKAIAAGEWHTVALKEDGSIWAWGDNEDGQLGDGRVIATNKPVQAIDIEEVVAIASGNCFTVALKQDGTVWTWGLYFYYDPIENVDIAMTSTQPVCKEGIEDVKAIAAGSDHVVALKEDGTVWGWGSNFAGQLGAIVIADSDTNNEFKYERFMQVSGMEKVKAIAAGYNYTIALKKDGSLWVWGRNNLGNLGDDSIETISIEPVPVKDLEDVIAVSAADDHIVALKKDGTVWSWGLNLYGQLGDGTVMYTSKPVQTKIK